MPTAKQLEEADRQRDAWIESSRRQDDLVRDSLTRELDGQDLPPPLLDSSSWAAQFRRLLAEHADSVNRFSLEEINTTDWGRFQGHYRDPGLFDRARALVAAVPSEELWTRLLEEGFGLPEHAALLGNGMKAASFALRLFDKINRDSSVAAIAKQWAAQLDAILTSAHLTRAQKDTITAMFVEELRARRPDAVAQAMEDFARVTLEGTDKRGAALVMHWRPILSDMGLSALLTAARDVDLKEGAFLQPLIRAYEAEQRTHSELAGRFKDGKGSFRLHGTWTPAFSLKLLSDRLGQLDLAPDVAQALAGIRFIVVSTARLHPFGGDPADPLKGWGRSDAPVLHPLLESPLAFQMRLAPLIGSAADLSGYATSARVDSLPSGSWVMPGEQAIVVSEAGLLFDQWWHTTLEGFWRQRTGAVMKFADPNGTFATVHHELGHTVIERYLRKLRPGTGAFEVLPASFNQGASDGTQVLRRLFDASAQPADGSPDEWFSDLTMQYLSSPTGAAELARTDPAIHRFMHRLYGDPPPEAVPGT